MNFHSPSPKVKYGIDPAPQPLNGGVQIDNLQELLLRRREIAQNKAKFHLSEADCDLLLTNANEFYFKDKQVIVQEGQELPSVYRIKSGNVNLMKHGKVVSVISQGWFLGETMFLNGRTCVYDASLVANGAVTVGELNLTFVKRLFEVDHTLALKFYRTLAAKLSSVHFALFGHLLGTCLGSIGMAPLLANGGLVPISLSSSKSNSNTTLPSLNSSSEQAPSFPVMPSSPSSSASPSSPLTPSRPNASITAIASPYSSIVSNTAVLSKCPNLPDSFLFDVINRKKPTRQITKRKSIANIRVAFKVYQLEGNGKGIQSCRLKKNKMNLTSESFGFKHKTSIVYSKIKNIVRTTEKSVTVIYEPFLGKTLFFKTVDDAEEFYGLTTSLIEAVMSDAQKLANGAPISTSSLSITDSPSHKDEPDAQEEELKSLLRGLASQLELKKGDILIEEGDLYQRIYTVLSGEVHATRGNTTFGILGEGEVIGLPTLLHLRPCPSTLIIGSETATILMLPAYKIIEVSKANLPLAARLYKKAATTLQVQIEAVLARTRALADLHASSVVASSSGHDLHLSISTDGSSSSSPASSPRTPRTPPTPRASPSPHAVSPVNLNPPAP